MKPYVKPELFYESFELSQHIADCAWELQAANENVCYAVGDEDFNLDPYMHIFQNSSDICVVGPPEGYCYYSASNAIGLYAS